MGGQARLTIMWTVPGPRLRLALRIAAVWSLLWPLFGLLFLMVVLEQVPLGSRFNVSLASALFASVLTALLLAIWLVWSPSRRRVTLSRRAEVLLIGGGMLLVVGISVGTLVGRQMLERGSRAVDAEAARQRFVVPDTSRLPSDDVERALAEFERAARRLEGLWPSMEGRGPVVLELYPNLEEYRTERGLQWSRGSVECREHETVISVPLEDDSGIMTGGPHPSPAPLHEMVHATVCQGLGAEAMLSIPSWYHEGLAQLHAKRGIARVGDRVFNRLVVRFRRGGRLPPDRFCFGQPTSSPAEAALFYSVAWEFVRFLSAQHGVDDLDGVVEDVAAGIGFRDSLLARFGEECTDLYGRWLENW